MRFIDSKKGNSGEAVYLLLLWGYILVYYLVLRSSRYISVLITIANFLSVKTLYVLVDAFGYTANQYDQLRVLLSMFLILGSLVLGSVSGSLAYAILGEVLLYTMQYGQQSAPRWQVDLMLLCGAIFPALSPAVAFVSTAEQVSSFPVFSADNRGAAFLAERFSV